MSNLKYIAVSLVVLCASSVTAVHAQIRQVFPVLAAEVTSSSAIIWSQYTADAMMRVSLEPIGENTQILKELQVNASRDFSGQIEFGDLAANTPYSYTVSFEIDGLSSAEITGVFKTAPQAQQVKHVRLAWAGDFGGQNVCRDLQEGYPIFNAIANESVDMFIGLGDMIYADHTCKDKGLYGNQQIAGNFSKAADIENYWGHWRYARADAPFQKLLRQTAYYGIWDDHEVVNDFGPLHDTRQEAPYRANEHLKPIGLQAFLDYTPIRAGPRVKALPRLYRDFRWGKHAHVFFLDNRQYRNANLAQDSQSSPKTMLGREQFGWLKGELENSDATWKIIVSSVPISIPTGYPPEHGRDGWANFDADDTITTTGIPVADTGFEQELRSILKIMVAKNMNVLFITTDVHFAEVFRYQPFENQPHFTFVEVVVGPGNAGIYPNREFDKTFGTESLFFWGPRKASDVASWEQAKKWFNFGLLAIDNNGNIQVQVKDTQGATLFERTVSPRL